MYNTFPCRVMSVSLNSNTTGATSGIGTAYPSRAPEFTHSF